MNGLSESIRGFFLTLSLVARTTVSNVSGHWALAIVSLIAAGIIWVVIQDIENPRVEGTVPLEGEAQGIPVEFVNLSPDFVVTEASRVRVRVEAREDQLPELRPGDFRAIVDLEGVEPGIPLDLPVTVEPADDTIRVLEVIPSTVRVDLEPVAEEEFEVEVNVTGSLPPGFEETEARTIAPPFVTVSGRPDLVEAVDRVEIDVNLSGQRQSFEVSGDLIARNRNGDRQTVTLSEDRAMVEFTIEQQTVERLLPVRPRLTGSPAPGYRATSIELQPSFVTVSGPQDVLEPLEELTLEPIDLGGATSDITQTRNIQRPSNVELERDSVRVDVGIAPIVCEDDQEAACGATTFHVAPRFTDVPEGLTVAPGSYTVQVAILGPLDELADLAPGDLDVTASLADLSAGISTVEPEVTVEDPFVVDDVEPLSVDLIPGQVP